MANFTSIAKAKLKVFDPTKIEYTPDHHLKAIHKEVDPKKIAKADTIDPFKRRVLTLDNRPKISLDLKRGVADFPYKDRALAQEVAEVLEDIFQAVDEGRESLDKEKPKNKLVEAKEKDKEIQAKQEEIAEQKRKQRAQEIKSLIQEPREKKDDKTKKGDDAQTKKKDEFWSKHVVEAKSKAEEYKEKKAEEKARKVEEEKEKKTSEKEDKKSKFKTFNSQKVEEMVQNNLFIIC